MGGISRGSCRVSAQDLGSSESPRGQAAGRVCWFLQCLQRSYQQNAEYPSRLKKCLPVWVWERHCCSFQSEDFVLIRVFKGFFFGGDKVKNGRPFQITVAVPGTVKRARFVVTAAPAGLLFSHGHLEVIERARTFRQDTFYLSLLWWLLL